MRPYGTIAPVTPTSDPAKEQPTWWRVLPRDPVLLVACTVLAGVALGAAGLTAIDRTAADIAGDRTGADVAVDRTAARAGADAPTSVAGPPPLRAGVPGGVPARSGATGPTPSADGAASPCPRSGAVVRPTGMDAAMGLRAIGLELTNCGDRPYPVRGYPAVRLLGPARTPLSVEVITGRSTITALPAVDAPAVHMTLQPGQRATAVLVWRSTSIDGPADRATYLEVTARAGEQPQTVVPAYVLDLGTGGRLGVGPWTRSARR